LRLSDLDKLGIVDQVEEEVQDDELDIGIYHKFNLILGFDELDQLLNNDKPKSDPGSLSDKANSQDQCIIYYSNFRYRIYKGTTR
jgi:hypothetical protein